MPEYRTPAERWTALVQEFRHAGLTHAEFCKRRGLSIHTFRKHLSANRPAQDGVPTSLPTRSDPAAFLPVTLRTNSGDITTNQSLELILSNGRKIAVTPGFDPHTLRQLLAIAEEAPCSE